MTPEKKWTNLLKFKLAITAIKNERDAERTEMLKHQEKFRSLAQKVSDEEGKFWSMIK